MTIRFSCGVCDQPIEIDDEWASKQAACPYCRKTITVPSESTLTDISAIPTANPVSPAAGYGWPAPLSSRALARQTSPNYLAIVAAILAGAAVVLVILLSSVMAAHRDELAAAGRETQERIESGESFMSAINGPWGSLIESNGGIPPDWVVAFGLLEMGLLLTGLAAFVCSIIACFRPRRRRLAIAALVVTCLLPFVTCGIMGSVVDM